MSRSSGGVAEAPRVAPVRVARRSAGPSVLEHIREELAEAEQELIEYRQGELPLLERVQRLRRAERELSGGELTSKAFSDPEIVLIVRDNASAEKPIKTPEVASLLAGNGKGYARRLKRMAEKDGLIAGSAAEGYFVPGFDHGRKIEGNPQK